MTLPLRLVSLAVADMPFTRPKIGRPLGSVQVDPPPLVDGVHGYMLFDDGMVKPEWRDHVASVRRRREMMPIGEAMVYAEARR